MTDQYRCNYCGIEHDWATRSEEHVIPQWLGNRSLVLPDVCDGRNNFFAQAFENAVKSSAFMRAALLHFGVGGAPKKGAHYVEPLRNVDGGTEHLWWVDGRPILRDFPAAKIKNATVPFVAFDDDGSAHDIKISLPFEYLSVVNGDRIEIEKAEKKMRRDLDRVLNYVQKLAENLSIDPILAEDLRRRGLRLVRPERLDVEFTKEQGSPDRYVNVEQRSHLIDADLWGRFCLKIGWCFACAKLGRELLVALGGQVLIDYLATAGEVDPVLVEACTAASPEVATDLFRRITVGGRDRWLWRKGINDSVPLLTKLPTDVLAIAALNQNLRKTASMQLALWVMFDQPGLIREPEAAGAAGSAHRLTLARVERDELAAVVCTIRLFGGVFIARVQVCPAQPVGLVPDVAYDESIPIGV